MECVDGVLEPLFCLSLGLGVDIIVLLAEYMIYLHCADSFGVWLDVLG